MSKITWAPGESGIACVRMINHPGVLCGFKAKQSAHRSTKIVWHSRIDVEDLSGRLTLPLKLVHVSETDTCDGFEARHVSINIPLLSGPLPKRIP